ncbi:hypothetical protein H0W91_00630 [Patescibacteria group bacterium]|nr:hypothetical protein [Patescibacteria group bacterium]
MLRKFKSIANDWVTTQKKRYPNNRAFKSLTMCKKCYTFYYKKSWHFERPDFIDLAAEEEIPVKFTQCPACLEQELSLYENESNLPNFVLDMG